MDPNVKFILVRIPRISNSNFGSCGFELVPPGRRGHKQWQTGEPVRD